MRIHFCEGRHDLLDSAETWQGGFRSQQQSDIVWFAFAQLEHSANLVVHGSAEILEYLVENLVLFWVIFLQCLQSFVTNRGAR